MPESQQQGPGGADPQQHFAKGLRGKRLQRTALVGFRRPAGGQEDREDAKDPMQQAVRGVAQARGALKPGVIGRHAGGVNCVG